MFRPALPKVYLELATNAAVLNHSCTVGSERCQSPTTFGRSLLPVLLCCPVLDGSPWTVRLSGMPVSSVKIGPTLHPPNRASVKRFQVDPNVLPFPNGKA